MTHLRIPSAPHSSARKPSVLRRLIDRSLRVTIGILSLVGILSAGAARASVHSSPPTAEGPIPAGRPSSDGPIVVAVVLGRSGTDDADALAPYEVFASGAARQPDLVVIPAVNDPAGEQEAELRTWIVQQAHAGARILGICAG